MKYKIYVSGNRVKIRYLVIPWVCAPPCLFNINLYDAVCLLLVRFLNKILSLVIHAGYEGKDQ